MEQEDGIEDLKHQHNTLREEKEDLMNRLNDCMNELFKVAEIYYQKTGKNITDEL